MTATDDDLTHEDFPIGKGVAKVQRTPAQVAAAERAAERAAVAEKNKQLAQMANLIMAGYSLSDIGAAIGATPEQVDQMLTEDTARFVRNQPSLRIWVRNYISGKYHDLLDAVWDEATDKLHPEKLDNQDRALRILNNMAKLHGAEAPVQSEVKVEAAPEAVERMVASLAAAQGQGYDTDIFDAEVIHEAGEATRLEIERSAEALGQPQPGDDDPEGFGSSER